MKKNVILVVNPISGDIDKSEIVSTILFFAKNNNFNSIIYNTSGHHDTENLLKLYHKNVPERIIILGGDGTIKMVVEAMENIDVILGIIPGGSANGLAVDLNLLLSLEENLNIAFFNNYTEIDIIRINDKISIHLSDLGINAELIKNYEKSAIRGKWGYALQTLTTLIDLEDPFVAQIHTNNSIIHCKARMIVIANSQKYGTGVIINPNGAMNDGKFELVILKSLDVLLLGKIITGNMPIDSDDIVIISTDKATIETDYPVNFQIDGEYCGAQTVLEVHILHKQMKIAIP